MASGNLYSRIILWAKVTLPTVALMLLSSLFLFSNTPDPEAALPYAEFDVDQINREQRVTQPRFAGVLGNERELVMIAESVAMATGQTDQIHAQSIEGRMDLPGRDYLTLDAHLGDIDMAAQLAEFRDGVVMESSFGYRLESETLDMALNRFEMRSDTPVHVTGPRIDLTAETMEVTGPEGATILHFNGSVRLLYGPES